jgi:hypothetical protein
MRKSLSTFGVALLALTFGAQYAKANPVLLENGNTLSVTAYGVTATFTVANCSIGPASGPPEGCTGNEQLVQDGSHLGVLVESASGGDLVPQDLDMVFDLNINVVTPNAYATGLELNAEVSGLFANAGETLSNGPGLNVGDGTGPAVAYFTPTRSFTGTKDLNTFSIFGESESIGWVTQDLLVPEPDMAGFFVAMIAGLALVRRKRLHD